jgi:hypothetical protein
MFRVPVVKMAWVSLIDTLYSGVIHPVGFRWASRIETAKSSLSFEQAGCVEIGPYHKLVLARLFVDEMAMACD